MKRKILIIAILLVTAQLFCQYSLSSYMKLDKKKSNTASSFDMGFLGGLGITSFRPGFEDSNFKGYGINLGYSISGYMEIPVDVISIRPELKLNKYKGVVKAKHNDYKHKNSYYYFEIPVSVIVKPFSIKELKPYLGNIESMIGEVKPYLGAGLHLGVPIILSYGYDGDFGHDSEIEFIWDYIDELNIPNYGLQLLLGADIQKYKVELNYCTNMRSTFDGGKIKPWNLLILGGVKF